MIALLYTIHVLICFFLIAVVLLQQGKGADLSVFGGGATQTAFGARGAATVLHKMTVISFVLFIVTTLGIGVVQSKQGASDIFEGLDEEAAATVDGEEATGEAAPDAEEPAEEPEGAFAVESGEADGTEGADEAAADSTAADGSETTDETGDGESASGDDSASEGESSEGSDESDN